MEFRPEIEVRGGSCDQARHRKRYRAENKRQPGQGRASGGSGFRGDEKFAGTRKAHRIEALRRVQCKAAQDRYRTQPAHRAAGKHPARQSRPLQTGQRTSGTASSRQQVLTFAWSSWFGIAPIQVTQTRSSASFSACELSRGASNSHENLSEYEPMSVCK